MGVGMQTDLSTPPNLTTEQAYQYHERAGIMEYDGKENRAMSEAAALGDVIRKGVTNERIRKTIER